MEKIHDFIKNHSIIGGLTSLSSIGFGQFLTINTINLIPMIVSVLQIFSYGVGIIVGLITIYTFLEKKDLLPRFLQRSDRKSNIK
jgi:hypothetical protein